MVRLASQCGTTNGAKVLVLEDLMRYFEDPTISTEVWGFHGSYTQNAPLVFPFFRDGKQFVCVADDEKMEFFEFAQGTILEWACDENYIAFIVEKNGAKFTAYTTHSGEVVDSALTVFFVNSWISKKGILAATHAFGYIVYLPDNLQFIGDSISYGQIRDMDFQSGRVALIFDTGILENVFDDNPTFTMIEGYEHVLVDDGSLWTCLNNRIWHHTAKGIEEFKTFAVSTGGPLEKVGDKVARCAINYNITSRQLEFLIIYHNKTKKLIGTLPKSKPVNAEILDCSAEKQIIVSKIRNSIIIAENGQVRELDLSDMYVIDARIVGDDVVILADNNII